MEASRAGCSSSIQKSGFRPFFPFFGSRFPKRRVALSLYGYWATKPRETLKPQTPNPKPQTPNPKPQTLNPKYPNPKTETLYSSAPGPWSFWQRWQPTSLCPASSPTAPRTQSRTLFLFSGFWFFLYSSSNLLNLLKPLNPKA